MSDNEDEGCAYMLATIVVGVVIVGIIGAIVDAILTLLKFVVLSVLILGASGLTIWTLVTFIKWMIEVFERRREELAEKYNAWLRSSPVDAGFVEAQSSVRKLEAQSKELLAFLAQLRGRTTADMLPTHRAQHEETLRAVNEAERLAKTHERMWRERLIVLTAQRMFQCALRSIPPWLGGAPFEDYPQGSEDLWPKKPNSITETLAETAEAVKKIDTALASMKEVERKEIANASREAKVHLQTLMERAQALRDRLSTRLAECQTYDDRQRAFALIAQTPAGRLQAGELDAFFPKDIEPIETELLMSVPQSYDLEDKLRELQALATHNTASSRADHEVEALTQARGNPLPPRRPKTTR